MVAVRDAMRKQVRAEISQLMQEICEESWLILDLLAQTQTMEKQWKMGTDRIRFLFLQKENKIFQNPCIRNESVL